MDIKFMKLFYIIFYSYLQEITIKDSKDYIEKRNRQYADEEVSFGKNVSSWSKC